MRFIIFFLFPFVIYGQTIQHAPLQSALEPILDRIHQDPISHKQLQQLKKDFSTQLNDYESLYLDALIAESLLNIDDRKALAQANLLEQRAKELGFAEVVDIVTIFEIISVFHATRRYEYSIVGQIGPKRLKSLNPSHRLFGRLAFYSLYGKENLTAEEINQILTALKEVMANGNSIAKTRAHFYYHAAQVPLNYYYYGISEKAYMHYEKLMYSSFNDTQVKQITRYSFIRALLDLAQWNLAHELIKEYEKTFEQIQQDGIDRSNYFGNKHQAYEQLDDRGININSFRKKMLEAIEPYKADAPLVYCRAQVLKLDHLYDEETRQSAKPVAKSLLHEFPNYQTFKNYIAYCDHHGKRHDEALNTFQKNLQKEDSLFVSDDIFQNPIKEDKLYKKFPAVIYWLNWKSRALYQKGKVIENNAVAVKYLKKAIETAELAIKYHDSNIEAISSYYYSSFTSTNFIHTTYNFKVRMHYELYQRTKDKAQLDLMLYNIERAKNLGFRQAQFNRDNRSPDQINIDSLMALYQYKAIKYQNLGDLASLADLDSLYLLSTKLDQEVDSLRSADPSFVVRPKEAIIPSIKELQSALEPRQAYLTIQEKWKETYAMFITKDTVITHKYRLMESWDKVLKKMNRQLQSPMQVQQSRKQRILESAHELYTKVLFPFESELKKVNKLVVSPESDLYYIPFEILLPKVVNGTYVEQPFMIKTHEFQYQYSAALFIKNQQQERIKDQSVLAFAPVFNNGNEVVNERSIKRFGRTKKLMRGMRNDAFTPLPYTKEEVSTIAQIMQSTSSTEVFLNENANKSKFIKALEAKPYEFVHIATHGFVNYYNPFLCALACHNDGQTKDNFLYAAEIRNLKIEADLVVLSSCESGIGRVVSGSGLIALNQSFLTAGAKSVLFSLWKVNDEYTKNLMIDFYQNCADGQSYTSALHQAKLKMLSNPDTAQPRFWAPFVLMGN